MRSLWWLTTAFLGLLAASTSAAEPARVDHWLDVVRQSPYWVSQGVFDNLKTIRQWVLAGESFCENRERHILFDRRATFLGYLNDADTADATQKKLNELRRSLAESGRVSSWAPGAENQAGYPFALSCNQPDAQLSVALGRYKGIDEAARLWGTWDGMRIGAEGEEVSLHEAIRQVYKDRHSQGHIAMPPSILSTLAGKILIESAGQKLAHSAADARGIMQLSEAALRDCGLAERFYFHRLAQIDCALRLLEQNHRNLRPPFDEMFGHLPEEKRERLYDLLLIQAYHAGVGRVREFLTEPELSRPAIYFAQHQQKFSAGDIALGMIFHNLGRSRMGFASLYYVTDVGVATDAVCGQVNKLPGCDSE